MLRLIHLTAAAALVLSGCASVNHAANEVGNAVSDAADDINEPEAVAHLRDSQGRDVGKVTLEQHDKTVEVDVEVHGLPAGTHGIHFHAVGSCTPPDFASAGGHFNPTNMHHGLANPAGPHAGDLPNLVTGADGKADIEFTNDRIILLSGANSVFDADGTAVVIHASADDQRSDPSGNSGARIACGVIVRD